FLSSKSWFDKEYPDNIKSILNNEAKERIKQNPKHLNYSIPELDSENKIRPKMRSSGNFSCGFLD
ncbi:MAG: hypothetical protein M1419_05550, partial [Bacteroidetes bacterium]|nr:hypothetical protein [Bacteroidota bacterium]